MEIKSILKKIQSLKKVQKTTLITVSKTRSIEEILKIYDQGQKDFGENYVEEIIEKSQKLPKDINWHFIGHLQSNKVNKLFQMDLNYFHTLHSIKLSKKINNKLKDLKKKLNVFIQVNVSEEISKNGCSKNEVKDLVKFVKENCEFLNLIGFMMIGGKGIQKEFEDLRFLRDSIDENLELSMGMSGDFEEAILNGSNYVRIGSLIFGPRNY